MHNPRHIKIINYGNYIKVGQFHIPVTKLSDNVDGIITDVVADQPQHGAFFGTLALIFSSYNDDIVMEWSAITISETGLVDKRIGHRHYFDLTKPKYARELLRSYDEMLEECQYWMRRVERQDKEDHQ